MKKLTVFLILLFSLCLPAFADDSYRTAIVAGKHEAVYPIDREIGQIVKRDQTKEHLLLSEALSADYDFNWSEKYLAPQSRKILTSLYSSVFSDLLPAEDFVFSKGHTNADNSVSITVKFPKTGTIISFVIFENQIVGITSVKN